MYIDIYRYIRVSTTKRKLYPTTVLRVRWPHPEISKLQSRGAPPRYVF